MRKLLILLALAYCGPLLAQTFVVEDIRIEGIQRVSPGSVFSALPARVGDTVDTTRVQSSIRSLFATGLFSDIRIERDGNVLVVRVAERPAIADINIEGNKIIKTEDLLVSMNDAGLAEGQIMQPATLEAVARSLGQEYVAQGHYGSSVSYEIVEQPLNRVSIEMEVDEGKKARIEQINIIGNELFDDKELLDQFELGTTNWRSWATGNNKYSRESLNGDLDRLESFYRDRGYFEFVIDSSQIAISPNRESVYITINLSEGDIYRVGEVGFMGDLVLEEEELRRYLLVADGQVYSQALVSATRDLIVNRLANAGYTFAEVEDIAEFEEGSGEVDLSFFVNPGQRVYVRRVEFRGNLRTEDEVLRREMRQLESAPASDSLIELGKIRLDRTGFFREVTSEIEPVAGTQDQIDVIYNVDEQASGSLSASVGYAQVTGLLLGFNLQENNFLGSGNSVGIGINKSTFQNSYSLNYTNPYFTPDGVSAGFSLYSRSTDYGEINVSTFSTDVLGLNVNFGYPLSEISSIRYGAGYERLDLSTGVFASPEIRALAPSGNEVFNLYKLDLTIGRSTLNRGILPTAGSSQNIGFEVAAPGSDISYAKLTVNAQAFFDIPLHRDMALKLRSRIGYGEGLGDTERLPFFENYYAGGFGSVRGFESNVLGPRESGGGSFEPDPIGGNVLLLYGAEIILPTPFLPDPRSTQAVLFFDAGNVFDTNCTTNPTTGAVVQPNCFEPSYKELRYSAGIGVTWISGFGPMSFSFGRSFNGGQFEDREMFQFTLGQTF